MKKLLLALILVLALSVPAFAGNQDATNTLSPNGIANTGNNNTIYGAGSSPTTVGNITANGGAGGAGGNATLTNTNTASVRDSGNSTNNIGNIGALSPFSRTFSPEATASAVQGQQQGQQQGQLQGQGQSQESVNVNKNTNINDNTAISKADSSSKSNAENKNNQNINWTQTFEDARELPAAIPIIPQVIPLIQGGRVGDVTSQVVKFKIAAKPYNGELVTKILKVVDGSIFDRVRLEDIERDLLSAYNSLIAGKKWYEEDKSAAAKARKENGDRKDKIRYLIQYKDSAMGAGMNVGGAGSINALNGGSGAYGGTGSTSVGFGYTRSTADPLYIIKFFLVE